LPTEKEKASLVFAFESGGRDGILRPQPWVKVIDQGRVQRQDLGNEQSVDDVDGADDAYPSRAPELKALQGSVRSAALERTVS
jgi:hypothetical protein